MPLVACPKCSTNLRVPEGATGAVRCPKCQTVFQPPRQQPAFEVVEDAPPAPPPRPAAPRPTAPAPRPAVPAPQPARPAPPPKPAALEPDFEPVEDEPKKPAKRVTAREDDDDDYDRPRKRRRDDDDDDYDDRPRGRRRGRDDDYDDDDDYDRRRKKRRRYDDDEDDRPSGPVAGAAAAKVGMLMLSISFWIQMGMFALLAVFMFVGWMGGFVTSGLMTLPGILGLGAWVVGAIGLGFSLAGPARSRGLAIAATAVAAVHLILCFVVANNTDAGLFSERGPQRVAVLSKVLRLTRLAESAAKDESRAKYVLDELKKLEEFGKDNKEDLQALSYYETRLSTKDKDKDRDRDRDVDLGEVLFFGGSGTSSSSKPAPTGMRWVDVATELPFLDRFLAVVSYHNKYFTEYLLGLFGGLLELALLILTLLLIGSLSKAVRGNDAAGKAKFGLIGVCAAVGAAVLISLLVAVMIDGAQNSVKKIAENTTLSDKERRDRIRGAFSTIVNADGMGRTLIYGLYAGMMLMPAIAALQASAEAGRRARRR